MFKELDVNSDGQFSWREFEALLNDELLKTWLSTLDIEAKDLRTLFGLLDHGDGNISVEEFLENVGMIKGNAKSVDMMATLRLLKRIEEAERINLKMQRSPR